MKLIYIVVGTTLELSIQQERLGGRRFRGLCQHVKFIIESCLPENGDSHNWRLVASFSQNCSLKIREELYSLGS